MLQYFVVFWKRERLDSRDFSRDDFQSIAVFIGVFTNAVYPTIAPTIWRGIPSDNSYGQTSRFEVRRVHQCFGPRLREFGKRRRVITRCFVSRVGRVRFSEYFDSYYKKSFEGIRKLLAWCVSSTSPTGGN